MGKASETIFSGTDHIIAMADVAFIERQFDGKRNPYGGMVVMKQSHWNSEIDSWDAACYLSQPEFESFVKAWSYFRYEIDEPADIRPDAPTLATVMAG